MVLPWQAGQLCTRVSSPEQHHPMAWLCILEPACTTARQCQASHRLQCWAKRITSHFAILPGPQVDIPASQCTNATSDGRHQPRDQSVSHEELDALLRVVVGGALGRSSKGAYRLDPVTACGSWILPNPGSLAVKVCPVTTTQQHMVLRVAGEESQARCLQNLSKVMQNVPTVASNAYCCYCRSMSCCTDQAREAQPQRKRQCLVPLSATIV